MFLIVEHLVLIYLEKYLNRRGDRPATAHTRCRNVSLNLDKLQSLRGRAYGTVKYKGSSRRVTVYIGHSGAAIDQQQPTHGVAMFPQPRQATRKLEGKSLRDCESRAVVGGVTVYIGHSGAAIDQQQPTHGVAMFPSTSTSYTSYKLEGKSLRDCEVQGQ
ncbi:hypothetical protein J6590_035926 [Homalodisca vitripennis]|nr:hypothetical protein J6590_035926 [Homalodisca vitripennis]